MKLENWQRIHNEFISSCIDLFAANGVTLALASDDSSGPSQGETIISFIGFVGEQIRGHITVLAPVALIRRSHPLRTKGPVDIESLCDWSCELTNQLFGRTKNRLLEYGLLIQLSTASTALGRNLRGHDERREGFRVIHFDGGGERFTLLFDALASDAAPHTLRVVAPSVRTEGDIVLF